MYFFSCERNTALFPVFPNGYRFYIDKSEDSPFGFSSLPPEAFAVFSFTNSTCYFHPVAQWITKFLSTKCELSDEKCSMIETAVHEAISNGLVHGNLEMQGSYTSIESQAEYYKTLEKRLQLLPYRERRITISLYFSLSYLHITVQDQGAGFAQPLSNNDEKSLNGRGLQVIRHCVDHMTQQLEGRQITLSFAIGAPLTIGTSAGSRLADDLLTARILIIEDNPVNALLLSETLKKRGFTHIYSARNGEEGLALTLELKPDIVVLDLFMPVMDGFTYCQELRNTHGLYDIPILVQTGAESMEMRLRIFQCGASDIISKPIHPDEFATRLRLQLERKFLLHDLQKFYRRVETELQAARSMQYSLLPSYSQLQLLRHHHRLDVNAHFSPSSEIGGDIWGIFPLNDTHIAFYAADFSGHGITSALNAFRLHTLIHSYHEMATDPGKYLGFLNAHLLRLMPRGQFATMFLGVIDTTARKLLYASAAHPLPLMWQSTTGAIVTLTERDIPLGIEEHTVYETAVVPFATGDSLLLYSDALVETQGKNGETLEEKDITSIMAQHASDAPARIVSTLLQTLYAHQPLGPSDDLTIVSITGLAHN